MPVRLLPILTALTCGLWALIILSLSFTSSFPEATISINSISMPPKRDRLLIKLHRHYLQADVVRINIGTRLRAIMTYQPGRFNSLLNAREPGRSAVAAGRLLPRQIPIN
ncbi:hypothetical protein CVIRNUC_001229 [Coccomyxa viridis]|uniref:Uncharacterized protein n=1 Tax=Coccomyxa viridis TaxID=1274662 RepID=A0AAV1HUS7_9CHLO|nr:hypothetical protein CVIRNUC_001229 [Coccomyxa viridis]